MPELLAAHPELDLEEPDWYLRAPMARVLRGIQRRARQWLETSTLPSRPPWFHETLWRHARRPMWGSGLHHHLAAELLQMPSSNSVVVASS